MQAFSLLDASRLFWSQRSPWLLLFVAGLALSLRVHSGADLSGKELFLAAGVMVYWPFQEWWMHRWLLHMRPFRFAGKRREPEFARVHRLHHAHPEALEYIFLPGSHVLGAAAVVVFISRMVLGPPYYAATALTAATLSTMLYEWTHFLTHTRYRPRGAYYRKIWRLHRWHHYKNENYWFSFTVPFLDGWLGTGPRPEVVPRSKTARALED